MSRIDIKFPLGRASQQSSLKGSNTMEKGGYQDARQTKSYAGYTCMRVYYQTPRQPSP
jgi:hypothetical protein